LIWTGILPHIQKRQRYTLGDRIGNRFLDLIETAYLAYFCPREQKAEKIDHCIIITDTLKFLISIAWEGKLVSDTHFENIAVKLDEIGKMFGGWKRSLDNPEKKNRTL
jgi:uncharacterized ubiquitin-like protein YukD